MFCCTTREINEIAWAVDSENVEIREMKREAETEDIQHAERNKTIIIQP
jgi:hypothetical protein